VQKVLARRGFDVTHAMSPDDAMARLAEGPFDVVALDHYLSTGTGIEFLRRFEGSGSLPAVVYVTGAAETDVAVAALKAGASDFVPKTVGDDFMVLLTSALEQAVEKTRLRAQKDEAEREVRAQRDRAELMLREVNHRVANSLALVSSLVSLQANMIKDRAAKDALAETQARIVAISLVHKRLYTSGDVRFVDIEEYLTGLLEHLESSLKRDGHGASVITDLAQVKVPTDTAVNLGVVVTELVTNAFKYAYADGAGGEIRVRLQPVDDRAIELSVADDGVGWGGSGTAKGTGLGSRIIKAMAASLSGTVAYEDRKPGTTARLSFELGK
jgi:two-component sensor histidine kinase/CheY-like chemotaxis protein